MHDVTPPPPPPAPAPAAAPPAAPYREAPKKPRRRSSAELSAMELASADWGVDEELLNAFSRREDIAARVLQDAMTSVHSCDADEKFLSTSAAFDAQLGYVGSDLAGLKFRDLVAEDDRQSRRLRRASIRPVLTVIPRRASRDSPELPPL